MINVVFPVPGITPPPGLGLHRPWDGYHVWIHDVHTSAVMRVRGVNN